MRTCKIGIISDIHYAGAAEQARGDDYEMRGISNPALRQLVRTYRHFVWMRHPLRKSYLLDRFLDQAVAMDHLVGVGDYSCDSGFIGLSDPAAKESTRECLGKLRTRFGAQFHPTIGDHELGKRSFVGGKGGMRLGSWRAAVDELALPATWRVDLGCYTLLGVTSSLIALPVFKPDTLPEEREEWGQLREHHLREIRRLFESMEPDRRIILFCHDPTALPFLKREATVAARLKQIEQTFVGHLHTNLIMRASRLLAVLPFLWLPGHTGRRMASALREARHWRDFKLRLCPALGGIELLKDGGYWLMEVDPTGGIAPTYQLQPVPR